MLACLYIPFISTGGAAKAAGEWLWGLRSLRGRPGLSGSAAVVAGDELVDGSFRRRRLRPLGLFESAARVERVSRHFWERAGRLGVISVVGWPGARSAGVRVGIS